MQAALVATHAFFAEEAKTSMEAFFSRWATFAGQLEAALAHETEGKHLEGSKRARREERRGYQAKISWILYPILYPA